MASRGLFYASLSCLADAGPTSYKTFNDVNSYGGHGGTSIDSDDTAPTGLSPETCKARCDADNSCDCVTFGRSRGQCWKESNCVPDQFEGMDDYDVYLKLLETYEEYDGSNAYGDHGGYFLDTDDSAPEGLTVEQCQARCDGDDLCDCVSYQISKGKCWDVADCKPDEFSQTDDFAVYVRKVAPPSPTPAPCVIQPGGTTWMDCIRDAGEYQLPAGTYIIDRHFQLPDGVRIIGAGKGETFIEASMSVDNGCGTNTDMPGDPTTRIGFVLGSHTFIGHFTFVSKDDHRWQGYAGAALCGGAVFETPGCSDAYCQSENIGDPRYGDGGVEDVTVEDVEIVGSSDDTAAQLGVFVTQTKDLSKPSHDITIRGVEMLRSWADGINLHGAVYNALVENCRLEFQGDDNLAVWSHGDLATNITFRSNTLSQVQSTNPSKVWGNCIALYGGGVIDVVDTQCLGTNAAGVKFSTSFQGSWGDHSHVTVGGMFTDNAKPACYGRPVELWVDGCEPIYHEYFNKNCYTGQGADSIDSDETAPEGLSVQQCQARCNEDDMCDCVTFSNSDGKCWKESSCEPSECESASGFRVYDILLRLAVPTPSPPAQVVSFF